MEVTATDATTTIDGEVVQVPKEVLVQALLSDLIGAAPPLEGQEGQEEEEGINVEHPTTAAAASTTTGGAGAAEAELPPRKRIRDEGAVCVMCESADVKYRCPCCARRTCSAKCVQAHKTQFECSGIRPKTEYASTKAQLDENTVYRDFCFLEEAARLVGSAERGPEPAMQKRGPNNKKGKFPRFSREAFRFGTRVAFLPEHFARHKQNTSAYDDKRRCVTWRVDWLFSAAEASFPEESVPDTEILRDLLDGFVKVRSGNALRRSHLGDYVQADASGEGLRVFLKIESRPANDIRFFELDLSKSLRDNIANKHIIEYPTLHVALPRTVSQFPLLTPEELADHEKQIQEKQQQQQQFNANKRGRGRGRGGRGGSRGGRGRSGAHDGEHASGGTPEDGAAGDDSAAHNKGGDEDMGGDD